MIVTALEGLRSMASVVQYAAGCPVTTCRKVDTDSVRRAVTGTDVNFVMIGTGEVGRLLLLQGGKYSLLLASLVFFHRLLMPLLVIIKW